MLDNNSLIQVNKPLVEVNNRFNFFFRKRRLPKRTGPQLVVDRFHELLAGHKLNEAQLLKLIPDDWGWTLRSLSNEQELLAVLASDKLEALAKLFGVNTNWLEGSSERIYDWLHGYKRVDWFTEQLTARGWCDDELMMTILASDYKTGSEGSLNQFTMVFSHPIAEWDQGETTIYRHECFDAGPLPWDHQPARVNAFDMAYWFHHTANRHGWIPIVPSKYKIIKAIAEGEMFPGMVICRGRGGYDFFEDRLGQQ